MSGNIFDSHNVGVEGGCYWHVGVVPRDAAIRPITHRAAPATENYLTPSINSAEVEKPCSGHMLVSLLKPSSLTLPPGNSWEEFWSHSNFSCCRKSSQLAPLLRFGPPIYARLYLHSGQVWSPLEDSLEGLPVPRALQHRTWHLEKLKRISELS